MCGDGEVANRSSRLGLCVCTALPYLCNPGDALEVMIFGAQKQQSWFDAAGILPCPCPSRGSWRKEAYCWMQVQCKKAAILLKQSRKSNAVIIRGAETL